jgi:hypothetical protein
MSPYVISPAGVATPLKIVHGTLSPEFFLATLYKVDNLLR